MNSGQMPGFTAAVSLCRTIGNYRTTGTFDQVYPSIQPALPPLPYYGCLNRCRGSYI